MLICQFKLIDLQILLRRGKVDKFDWVEMWLFMGHSVRLWPGNIYFDVVPEYERGGRTG